MEEFLKMLYMDLSRRWWDSPSLEYTDALVEVSERLNPFSSAAPSPGTVGEAIGYWRLGVAIINGTEPQDPFKITNDGEIMEIIPE